MVNSSPRTPQKHTPLRQNNPSRHLSSIDEEQAPVYPGRLVAGRYYLRPQPREELHGAGPDLTSNTPLRKSKLNRSDEEFARYLSLENQTLSRSSAKASQEATNTSVVAWLSVLCWPLFFGLRIVLWLIGSAFSCLKWAATALVCIILNGHRIALVVYVIGTVLVTTFLYSPGGPYDGFSSPYITTDSANQHEFLKRFDQFTQGFIDSQALKEKAETILSAHGIHAEPEVVELFSSGYPYKVFSKTKHAHMYGSLLPKVFQENKLWVSAKHVAFHEAQMLIKSHPTLNFLEADPETGSFRLATHVPFSPGFEANVLLLTTARTIKRVHDQLLSVWIEPGKEGTWEDFVTCLKPYVLPVVEQTVIRLAHDSQVVPHERATYIMSLHHRLMKISPYLTDMPVIAKLLGDYFALLAVESQIALLATPLPQIPVPITTSRVLVRFTAFSNHLLTNFYRILQPNFASEYIGTRIVRPDTPRYRPPVFAAAHRLMDASQALREGMAPGECWAFSPKGGKLSFRLPLEVSPKRFIIHHPEPSQELPPSFIQLLVHAPIEDGSQREWEIMYEGPLEWHPAPNASFRHAAIQIPQPSPAASHFRLIASIAGDDIADDSFGCVYKIDLQGTLPAADNRHVGFF
ncbi:hypothetical protein DSO57_1004806 [Entomophthora muscae]|uniref:Uncharacterized protein n=1 Tax=Entomophthora muscae TaxID=34485 RepID=A0ACC2RMV3_9FUNG|nr:hypothetical protein DSO57_1004806 [Entomophthora muscae]